MQKTILITGCSSGTAFAAPVLVRSGGSLP